MTQATKFYLPFFKTNYPNGKLYTYLSETSTPANTYGVDGLNPNPIIFNDKGEATIYIDADLVYRFVLYDENDNLIYDMSGIKQLNGAPGDPGGPKGPTGDKGATGNQGLSGDQGAIGDKGPTGDKGLPYLTQIVAETTQTIYVPKGIDAIYITGCGGGGSGANWSNYLFMYKKRDTDAGYFSIACLFKNVDTGYAQYANNQVQYEKYNVGGFVFMPGSGFSGQAVYKKKITLDKTQVNKVDIYIGAGGSTLSTTLNGTNGSDTTIYVNDSKVLTLKGGLAGLNKFPFDNSNIPVLPTDGTPIRLNQGFNNGLLVFKSSYKPNYTTPSEGQALYIWNTSYQKTNYPSGYTIQNIQTSYYAPLLSINAGSVLDKIYTSNATNDLAGESNIFGELYTTYQNKYDITSAASDAFYKTAIKAGARGAGYGAGGDCYYGFNGTQNMSSNYFMSGYFNAITTYTMTFFDKTYIKQQIINQLQNFQTSDSYRPGVLSVPNINDTGGVWDKVDAVETMINNTSLYTKFNNAGFYDGLTFKKVQMSNRNNPNALGGSGANGYCIVEYGNITEHTPS